VGCGEGGWAQMAETEAVTIGFREFWLGFGVILDVEKLDYFALCSLFCVCKWLHLR
jgi:hypothetical protein